MKWKPWLVTKSNCSMSCFEVLWNQNYSSNDFGKYRFLIRLRCFHLIFRFFYFLSVVIPFMSDPDLDLGIGSGMQHSVKANSLGSRGSDLTSVADPWHFGVDPDPRIQASDYGSGSCYFRHLPSRCQPKLIFNTIFSAYYLSVQL
jgi:hypothetical protein